jgi:hypothetical protein
MKLGLFFEYVFRSQHNKSEFSHLCLLLFLLFLFFSYLHAVKEVWNPLA